MSFLSGKGKTIVDDTEEILKPGICSYCEEGYGHSVINIGKEKLEFYAVVSQKNQLYRKTPLIIFLRI